jgi:hypothetical protein
MHSLWAGHSPTGDIGNVAVVQPNGAIGKVSVIMTYNYQRLSLTLSNLGGSVHKKHDEMLCLDRLPTHLSRGLGGSPTADDNRTASIAKMRVRLCLFSSKLATSTKPMPPATLNIGRCSSADR